jgi:hypothetical protein
MDLKELCLRRLLKIMSLELSDCQFGQALDLMAPLMAL